MSVGAGSGEECHDLPSACEGRLASAVMCRHMLAAVTLDPATACAGLVSGHLQPIRLRWTEAAARCCELYALYHRKNPSLSHTSCSACHLPPKFVSANYLDLVCAACRKCGAALNEGVPRVQSGNMWESLPPMVADVNMSTQKLANKFVFGCRAFQLCILGFWGLHGTPKTAHSASFKSACCCESIGSIAFQESLQGGLLLVAARGCVAGDVARASVPLVSPLQGLVARMGAALRPECLLSHISTRRSRQPRGASKDRPGFQG